MAASNDSISKKSENTARNDNISKKGKNIAIGLIVTLGCALTDMFVLYTMFISGNIASRDAMVSAVLGGIVLDVPPYILGVVIANKHDPHIEDEELIKYKLSYGLLLGVIVIAFLVYFLLQVVIFIGGGDFNLGYKIVFSGVLDGIDASQQMLIAADEVSPGNAIQAVIPLVTSVISYVMGLILYEPRIKGLQRNLASAEETVIDLEAKVRKFENDFISRAKSAAIKYGKPLNMVDCDDASGVIADIFSIYHDNSLTFYQEAYSVYLKRIYGEAIENINNITSLAATATTDPAALRLLEMTDKEKAIIDRLKLPLSPDLGKIETAIQKIGGKTNNYRK